MDSSDSKCRQFLIPNFLFFSSALSQKNLPLWKMLDSSFISNSSPSNLETGSSSKSFMTPAPSEPGNIEMYSPVYFVTCTVGGILSCGPAHMAATPLDLVKCNMQIDPTKYKSISSGFGVLLKEQGLGGFFRGWVPTLFGYSAQGACKFGFYEFFKKCFSDIAGPEYATKYKTLIYLAGSASAEVIADVALCPFEAVKVRVQTQPGFARGLADGLPKFVKSEGTLGLYKGIVPLWGRQIPYTMMKFASLETVVEMIYKFVIPKPKNECSKSLQLGVSFAGGYLAGVLCAIVSHPADNLVSFLNNAKGATVGDAVRELGWGGLFTRGLPLRIVMIGTLTGAQWGIYDAFKVSVGLPTTGAVAPAAAPAELTKGWRPKYEYKFYPMKVKVTNDRDCGPCINRDSKGKAARLWMTFFSIFGFWTRIPFFIGILQIFGRMVLLSSFLLVIYLCTLGSLQPPVKIQLAIHTFLSIQKHGPIISNA